MKMTIHLLYYLWFNTEHVFIQRLRPHSLFKNSALSVKLHSCKALMMQFLVAAAALSFSQISNMWKDCCLKSVVSALRRPLPWLAADMFSSPKRLSKSAFCKSALCVITRMSFSDSFCVPGIGLIRKINAYQKKKMYRTDWFNFSVMTDFSDDLVKSY